MYREKKKQIFLFDYDRILKIDHITGLWNRILQRRGPYRSDHPLRRSQG